MEYLMDVLCLVVSDKDFLKSSLLARLHVFPWLRGLCHMSEFIPYILLLLLSHSPSLLSVSVSMAKVNSLYVQECIHLETLTSLFNSSTASSMFFLRPNLRSETRKKTRNEIDVARLREAGTISDF